MWTQALLIYLFLHYIPGPRASLLLSEHAKCLSVGVFVVAVPSANSSLCPLHGVLVIKLLWLGSESVLPHSALRYWGWGICTPQLCRISFASWAPLRIRHKGTLEGDRVRGEQMGLLPVFLFSLSAMPFLLVQKLLTTFCLFWHSQTRLYKAPPLIFFLGSDNLDLFSLFPGIRGGSCFLQLLFSGLLQDSLSIYSAFQRLYCNSWFSWLHLIDTVLGTRIGSQVLGILRLIWLCLWP